MTADVATAVGLVGTLGAEGRDTEADPWVDYPLGGGRDVNAVRAAFGSSVKRQPGLLRLERR